MNEDFGIGRFVRHALVVLAPLLIFFLHDLGAALFPLFGPPAVAPGEVGEEGLAVLVGVEAVDAQLVGREFRVVGLRGVADAVAVGGTAAFDDVLERVVVVGDAGRDDRALVGIAQGGEGRAELDGLPERFALDAPIQTLVLSHAAEHVDIRNGADHDLRVRALGEDLVDRARDVRVVGVGVHHMSR